MLTQPVGAGDLVLVASRSWARIRAICRVHARGLLAVNGELFHQNGLPVSPYSAFELYPAAGESDLLEKAQRQDALEKIAHTHFHRLSTRALLAIAQLCDDGRPMRRNGGNASAESSAMQV